MSCEFLSVYEQLKSNSLIIDADGNNGWDENNVVINFSRIKLYFCNCSNLFSLDFISLAKISLENKNIQKVSSMALYKMIETLYRNQR